MEGGGHRDPLALERDDAEVGYRTIDLLVDRLHRAEPPIRRASPAEMRDRLHGPPPDQPQPFDEILAGLDRDVLPFASRDGHPRFFGFVPFAGTWPGALGDLIASACNLYTGSWMESAGPSQVELEVLGWFKDWIGYPPDAAGLLVSGGSAGEHDRPRLRARERSPARCGTTSCSTCPTRRIPRSRAPPGSWASGRSRCACCRATRPSGSRRGRSRPRWTPTSSEAVTAVRRHGARPERRTPARSTRSTSWRRLCRERGRLAARRRGLRRFAALGRPRPRCSRARARRLGDARPAQVAVPAVRVRLPARPRRRRLLRRAFEITPSTCRTSRPPSTR